MELLRNAMAQPRSNLKQAYQISALVIIATLVTSSLSIDWIGNGRYFTLFHISEAIVASITGFLALALYFIRKQKHYFVASLGLLTIANTSFFSEMALHLNHSLDKQGYSAAVISLNTHSTNLILSIVLLVVIFQYLKRKDAAKSFGLKTRTLSGFFVVLNVLLVFTYFNNTSTFLQQEHFIGNRVIEFLSFSLYLTALGLLLKRKPHTSSTLSFWYKSSLIILIVAQPFTSIFTNILFDIHFFTGYTLYLFGLLSIFIGYSHVIKNIYLQSEYQQLRLRSEIKERELAERIMKKYRSLNDLILNASNEGIIGLDKEGKHIFVNKTAAELLGFEKFDLMDNYNHEIWHDTADKNNQCNGDNCHLLHSNEKNAFHNKQEFFIDKNGRSFPVSYSISGLSDNGEVIGSVVFFKDISQELENQNKIRLLSHVFEQSPTSVMITDKDGRIEYINKALEQKTGYTLQEIKGFNPKIFRSKDNTIDYSSLNEKLKNDQTWEGEFLNQTKTGENYWEQAIISPLKDEQGQTTHIVALKNDITMLKQSQEAYYSLFNNATSAIFITDRNGNFITVNKGVENIYGFSQQTLIDKDISYIAAKNENDLPCIKKAISKAFDGSPQQLEFWARTHSDTIFPNLIRLNKGRYYGEDVVIAFALDISELKKSQHSLQISEERFRTLFDNSSEGIVMLNNSGEIKSINKRFSDMFGYNSEEIGHKTINDFLPLEISTTKDIAFNGLLNQLQTQNNITALHKEGTAFPVEVAFSEFSVRDEKNIAAMIKDITEQNKNQLEIQNYTRALEMSNRELQDFAFIASHDLQEPLRKIISFGERLSSRFGDNLDPHAQNYLSRMQNSAERMRFLIKALLKYSRITSQGTPFETININAIVTDVQSDLELVIEEKSATITFNNLGEIKADKAQVTHLIQNIINNALKYSKQDVNPHIEIYTKKETLELYMEQQEVYSIYFKDNGIGFDEKYLEKIFIPFQRLHGRNEYEGTGIGLAICKKIMDRHKGRITAISKPKEGSTFIISFPINRI